MRLGSLFVAAAMALAASVVEPARAVAEEPQNPDMRHTEEKPVKPATRPQAISTLAVSPSLFFDWGLALSGGAAVLVNISGGCAHLCGSLYALAEGEVGLFGYQLRTGGGFTVIGEEFIPHVWFNFVGMSVAGAYLSRSRNFDRKLAEREDYWGITLSGAAGLAIRFGVYSRLKSEGRLLTFALGFGF